MKDMVTINVKTNNQTWKILDATIIKLVAVVLMFLDHVHQMFVSAGAPLWLSMAGRLVFPMFLFVSAESFHYTHSKKKYLQRLFLASLGMSFFTLFLQRMLPNSNNVVLVNNAFSTFFVAGLYMLSWDWLVDGIRNKAPKQIVKALLCGIVPILTAIPFLLTTALQSNENIPGFVIQFLVTLSLAVPSVLTVEGGFLLVVLGAVFYILRKHRLAQIVSLLLLSAFIYKVSGGIQWMMGFAAIPMALYNGKRGYGMKNFFYIFYPAHISLLYIISTLAL